MSYPVGHIGSEFDLTEWAKEIILEFIRPQISISTSLKQTTSVFNNELAIISVDPDIIGDSVILNQLIRCNNELKNYSLFSQFDETNFSYSSDIEKVILSISNSQQTFAIIDIEKLHHNKLLVYAFFEISRGSVNLFTPKIVISKFVQIDNRFVWKRCVEILDILYIFSILQSSNTGVKVLEVLLPMCELDMDTRERELTDDGFGRIIEDGFSNADFVYNVSTVFYTRPIVTKGIGPDSYWNTDYLPYASEWKSNERYRFFEINNGSIGNIDIGLVKDLLWMFKTKFNLSKTFDSLSDIELRNELISIFNRFNWNCVSVYNIETGIFVGCIVYQLKTGFPIKIISILSNSNDFREIYTIILGAFRAFKKLNNVFPLCICEHQGCHLDPIHDALTVADFSISHVKLVKQITLRDYDRINKCYYGG